MQFDLARSNLTDDELDEVMAEFGSPSRASGWGFSEIFEDLLSSKPKSVPIHD